MGSYQFAMVDRDGKVLMNLSFADDKSGMSHAAALRCLGQRWLKILWKMWQTRTSYDEALHTRNQIKHGSWVIALKKSPEHSTAA